MAATLSAGVNSLILKLDTPYDTIRLTDIRDDLIKVLVWCSASPIPAVPLSNTLVFDGLSLSITIPKLYDGTTLVSGTPYYVRYAFISDIDETVYTVSSQLTATPTATLAGDSVAIVFRRSATQPTTPTASPGTPTSPDTWYATTNTVPSSADPLWASTGTKVSGATNYTWQTPFKVEGTVGADGNSVAIVFRRNAGQPATPTASPGTPTAPATWYASTDTVPVSSDAMWSSVGTKLSGQTNYTWQLPIRVEGATGITGDSSRIAYKTQSQTVTAAATAATITPNPTTGTSSLPTGWSATITSPTAGQSLWAVDGIYNTPGNTVTWGTPYLTQGFPTTIQSDNYNATTLGWQIQRDTGNASFNNITARGSLITGDISAQRIEINKTVTAGTVSTPPIGTNRIEAFRSDNVRFLTLGGSGGTSADTAVIGISANANIINPFWVESTATTGSGILSNTLSTANAISSVSTGGGRLFYGSITNSSNPDAAIRLDIDSTGHTGKGIAVNMGASTGAAFAAGGTGNGYAFDGVTGTSGAGGLSSKSGIGYFRGIDFLTEASTIATSGTQAQLLIPVTANLVTSGPVTFNITLKSVLYQFILEYDSEAGFTTLSYFVSSIVANISNEWTVSATGTGAGSLTNPTFTFKHATVGVTTGTTSGNIVTGGSTYTGTFTPGTNSSYSNTTPVIIRLTPFPNDSTKVLRGDGSWGTIVGSGGGSVTSVGVSVPTGFTVSNSPITSSGTIAIGFAASASARKILYGNGTWDYADKRYNVLDYGATGLGIVDDATAIQSAINAATATGGTVYFPRGTYNISTSLTYSAPAGADPYYRVHFAGDGIGASLIKQTSTGNALTIAGNSGNPNLYTHIHDLGFASANLSGQALSITGGAYIYVESCHFTGFAYGFYGSNFLSSTFVSCAFRFNTRGFLIERIASTYSSSPNAVSMINCQLGANSLYGGWVLGPGVFNMQGGTIEGNGTTNGSSSNWGLRISEPSGATAIESSVGLSIDGVYFEVNKGIADLWITSSSSKAGVTNNINGCSFNRVGSTYTTNCILLDSTAGNGFNNVISGCGFKGLDGYTASASRMTILNSNNKVQLLGCSFDSATDAYVAGDANVFENPIRVAGITDLTGTSFLATAAPLASGTAAVGTSSLSARGDHVHPFSTSTATASGSGSIGYSAGVLTYTPPVIPAANTAGTGISITSGVVSLNTALAADTVLFTNNQVIGGVTIGTAANIGGFQAKNEVSAGFFTKTLNAVAGGLVGFYLTAPGNVSNIVTSAALRHTSSGTALPNIGTSTSTERFGIFYGTNIDVTGAITWNAITIPAPTASGTGFLKQDGTWATPTSAGVSSITGTAPVTASASTGAVTISMAAATASVNGYMTSTYANKLDGIATGATANTGTVTGVTATAPVASSGGTAPVISMAAATASVNGYMTSTYANKLDGIATGATANSAGTGISISSGAIALNTALAANTVLFTNNQLIGGVTVGTASNIGGFQAKNELSAGFFTKTLNAIAGGLVGVYLTTAQDANEVVTTSAFKHTSSAGARPDLGENTAGGRWGTIYAATGNFSGDITAFSDAKLKTNIETITDPFKAMDDVYGSTYDRIDTGEKGMGFIAQKFQKHYPDIVKENDEGTLSLKYLNIIAILWEQNRELNSRLKALEDKYDATNN